MSDVLVLGATGRIGRALRLIWGHRRNVLWQGRSQRAERPGWLTWTPGDPLPKVRLVLVLAGVISGDRAALAENARIAAAAVEAAERAGIARVFLASSVAVYGPTPANGAHEDSPCNPFGDYGLSKLEMEEAARNVANRVGVTALRLGNVVGADLLGRRSLAPEPSPSIALDRFADGAGPVRSYIGPSALARVLDGLGAVEGELPPVLNIACPKPVAMESLLRHASIPFHWRAAPPSAQQRVVMDCTRLDALCDLPADCADPARMAEEWLALRKVMS